MRTTARPASDVGDVSNDVTLTLLRLPAGRPDGQRQPLQRRAAPGRAGAVRDRARLRAVPGIPGGVFPKIILQSAAALRPSDLGLDTILTDLPNTAQIVGMDDRGPHQLHLADPLRPGRHPAEGLPAQPDVVQDPHGRLRRRQLRRRDRDRLDHVRHRQLRAPSRSPRSSAPAIKVGNANDAVELSTTIAQTIEEAGLQRAQVILPKDLFGNADALAISCPTADFQAGTCPANTIVGNAVAASPLQAQPLTGPVALVAPATPGPARPRARPARRAGAEAQGHDRGQLLDPNIVTLRRAARHPDLGLHAHLRRRPERAQHRHPRPLQAARAGVRRRLHLLLGRDPPPGGAGDGRLQRRDRRWRRRRRWWQQQPQAAEGEDLPAERRGAPEDVADRSRRARRSCAASS